MTTDQTIALARKHASCSNSRFCLEDAIRMIDSENFTYPERQKYAKDWAIRSLAYSIGIFHPDYKKATSCKA